MTVMIHRLGLFDLTSLTDRTTPLIVIPINVNCELPPRYWAMRARLASTGSVVSIVCIEVCYRETVNKKFAIEVMPVSHEQQITL
ncbi:MAG: hypothetical protein ABI407_18470 [Bradyrhizobium sp.]